MLMKLIPEHVKNESWEVRVRGISGTDKDKTNANFHNLDQTLLLRLYGFINNIFNKNSIKIPSFQ